MRKSRDLPNNLWVYRRVFKGAGWQLQDGKEVATQGAFDDSRQRLSVYVADVKTPREVLQLMLDSWQARRNKRMLGLHGSTVEELVDTNSEWRVVRIPLGALIAAELQVQPHEDVPADGHIEMCGDPSLYWDDLVDASEVLPPDECKAPASSLKPLK